MDLGAYVQIEELSKIAEANGIEVSRCRGYRLMKNEAKISEENIDKDGKYCAFSAAESEVRRVGSFIEWSSETNRLCEQYFIYKDGEIVDVVWNNIPNDLKERIKSAMDKAEQANRTQLEMYNKYVGRDDVLYIHARLGRSNWSDEAWKDYKDKDWFIEGCDDTYDSSYCDIYAKIRKEKRNE